jgi:hypothetical protein
MPAPGSGAGAGKVGAGAANIVAALAAGEGCGGPP